MTQIEQKFNQSCEMKEKGYNEQAYRLLYEGYLSYCNNPYMLSEVSNYALVGKCLYAFYFMPTIQNSNESIMEQVSSLAVLFLSKAIEQDSQNIQMRSCRVHILDEAREYIKHVFVESKTDIPTGWAARYETPTRRALIDLDKIIYSELASFPEIASINYFRSLKKELENDRLVPNRFVMSSIDENMKKEFPDEGRAFLNKFIAFLYSKVCVNGDIDFDTEYE